MRVTVEKNDNGSGRMVWALEQLPAFNATMAYIGGKQAHQQCTMAPWDLLLLHDAQLVPSLLMQYMHRHLLPSNQPTLDYRQSVPTDCTEHVAVALYGLVPERGARVRPRVMDDGCDDDDNDGGGGGGGGV